MLSHRRHGTVTGPANYSLEDGTTASSRTLRQPLGTLSRDANKEAEHVAGKGGKRAARCAGKVRACHGLPQHTGFTLTHMCPVSALALVGAVRVCCGYHSRTCSGVQRRRVAAVPWYMGR